MSEKPGEAGPPAEPPLDEPGTTFVRPPGEEQTQDLLGPASLDTQGGGDPDLPRLRPEELLAGRFSIVRFIARGGMGAVYEAEDLSLRTRVALKIIRSALLADSSALERFRREVLLARRVAHPNVCHVYEFYEARTADGVAVHFLTMELLDGETLARRLRDRGPMSPAEALPLAVQMCDGLQAAHAEGVVHRDFKSSNVLLVQRRGTTGESSSTRAVITDFGIARPLESSAEPALTGAAGMIGTPEYMAPEQVTGGTITQATDLYALGVVLYEMVTGQLPFTGETPLAAAAKRIHESPRAPHVVHPGLDRRWSDAILRCLAREPERRFRTAEEVHAALATRPRHPARRAGPIAALVLGLAALATGASLYLRHEARVRWARDVALPKVSELDELGRFPEALVLAEQVQAILPNEPKLQKLLPYISRLVRVETTPPGAVVEMKPYGAPDTEWHRLGVTPLGPFRVPRMLHLWRITRTGDEAVVRAFPGTYAPQEVSLTVPLDRVGSLPAEMVHVPGGREGLAIFGLEHKAVQLGDYLIDRTEVTNRQFKRFVDEGGYTRRELWKEPFVWAGRPLPWNEAMGRFRDRTGRPGPATWEQGDYPDGQGEHPVTGVSWYEATAYAVFVGKELPTVHHWSQAAGLDLTQNIVPVSNFRNAGTVPVATLGSIGPFGTHDMAGNVKEWCRNAVKDGRRFVLGGGWNEPLYMFNAPDAQDPFTRGASYGFRLVKLLDDRTAPEASEIIPLSRRDYLKEKPVQPEVAQAYLRLYAYDRTPLEARTEEVDDSADRWRREVVSFAAAYGSERVTAYLLTPRSGHPPFQLVVFFPGSEALTQRSSKNPSLYTRLLAPLLRSGRAVLLPIYKSTFERGDGLVSDVAAPTAYYRDHVIMWAKDFGRSLDWAETRPDLDMTRVAYYGASWGGALGPVMLAAQDRVKAGIWIAGGLQGQQCLPEADPFQFLDLVHQPVLMVNGRYDFFFPVEESQTPMFKLLGTPAKDKRSVLSDSGHGPPLDVITKEALDWLDRYLGPTG